jgi:hypothetical protein
MRPVSVRGIVPIVASLTRPGGHGETTAVREMNVDG